MHDMMENTDQQSDVILREKGYLQNNGKRQSLLCPHEKNTLSASFFPPGYQDQGPAGDQQESMVDENNGDDQTDGESAVYHNGACL